jgi:hypothetical protein
MVDRTALPLAGDEARRLHERQTRDGMYAADAYPNPDRAKSSREIAREILDRRMAEDRSADRRAEARLGDRERALEEHYRERGY